MPDLEPLLRFWRAHDDRFDRVEPTRWGAVVSDPRFPAIHDVNYARLEATDPVTLNEVEGLLLPALQRSASEQAHVLVFHPEEQTELLVAASTRGERLAWDLVMVHDGPTPSRADGAGVEELTAFDETLWAVVREAMRLFGLSADAALDQAIAIEREVMLPAGRRWFAVRGPDGAVAALATLTALAGVGFIDIVVTFPNARRRGYATALTCRALEAAGEAGVERVYLLAEPDGPAARLYEGMGFEPLVQLPSWISPLGGAPAGS